MTSDPPPGHREPPATPPPPPRPPTAPHQTPRTVSKISENIAHLKISRIGSVKSHRTETGRSRRQRSEPAGLELLGLPPQTHTPRRPSGVGDPLSSTPAPSVLPGTQLRPACRTPCKLREATDQGKPNGSDRRAGGRHMRVSRSVVRWSRPAALPTWRTGAHALSVHVQQARPAQHAVGVTRTDTGLAAGSAQLTPGGTRERVRCRI